MSMTRSGGTPRISSTLAASQIRLSVRRIENLNVVVDELHHVLVAGDDIDAIGRGCGFAGESADHVVGFEAGEFENRDAIGFEGRGGCREFAGPRSSGMAARLAL